MEHEKEERLTKWYQPYFIRVGDSGSSEELANSQICKVFPLHWGEGHLPVIDHTVPASRTTTMAGSLIGNFSAPQTIKLRLSSDDPTYRLLSNRGSYTRVTINQEDKDNDAVVMLHRFLVSSSCGDTYYPIKPELCEGITRLNANAPGYKETVTRWRPAQGLTEQEVNRFDYLKCRLKEAPPFSLFSVPNYHDDHTRRTVRAFDDDYPRVAKRWRGSLASDTTSPRNKGQGTVILRESIILPHVYDYAGVCLTLRVEKGRMDSHISSDEHPSSQSVERSPKPSSSRHARLSKKRLRQGNRSQSVDLPGDSGIPDGQRGSAAYAQ